MAFYLRKRIVSLSKLTLNRHNSMSNPFQTLLFSSSAKVSVPTAELLTTQHHISSKTALKASSTISHLKYPHITNSVLSCLNETGFSLPQIDLIINKYPRILIGNPNILVTKFKIFREKGFSVQDTIDIISKNSWVLHRSSMIRIGPSIDALKATMGSTDSVGRVLKKLSWFLKMDLSKTMIPNIEFLKKRFELSSSQLANFVILHPRMFLIQPETIKDAVRRLDEMGLKCSSKMYLHVVHVVCLISKEKLKLRMRLLQGLGLSDHDVLQILQTCPIVFSYSDNKINKTMEVLLGSGRADPSLPLKLVKLLPFSLEKRIKPRLEVVKTLEDRGLFPKQLSLTSILQITNIKFLERFVLSNSNALGGDCVIRITKKLALHSV